MPEVTVTRRLSFNAAHRVHNPELSAEENTRLFGKCNNPNWHGHNYVLEVTVAGEPDAKTGYVVDLAELKRVMHERVVDRMDHRNLNVDVDFLEGMMPSTENLCVAIWRQLEEHIPGGGRLHRVRLRETENNAAEYLGE